MTTRRAACVLTVLATMASRLRQLRPSWPIDSDPNGPDPAEDE